VSHRLRQPVETEDFFQRLALAGRTRDLLVPLVFLGGQTPVLIWQISTLADRFTGMHLLTAAAFISMALPMIVFFSL
jgi:ABC-type glycerol-3-phosphate transport system permease component